MFEKFKKNGFKISFQFSKTYKKETCDDKVLEKQLLLKVYSRLETTTTTTLQELPELVETTG